MYVACVARLDQGEAVWRQATVDFNAPISSVKLRAVRGGTSRAELYGDIAIDDITVSCELYVHVMRRVSELCMLTL